MIDGQGYSWTNVKSSQTGMPTFDGTSTINGNTGNGYPKITLLEVEEKEEVYIESTNYNSSKSSNSNIDVSEIIVLDKLKLKANVSLKKEQNSQITYDINICNKTKDNLIYTGFSTIENTNTNITITNNESKTPFIINKDTCQTMPLSFAYLDSSNIINQTTELTLLLNFDNTTKKYEYSGNYETFTVPYNGIYKIELWGAQGGGSSLYTGGKGGYTSGNIELTKDNKLYVYNLKGKKISQVKTQDYLSIVSAEIDEGGYIRIKCRPINQINSDSDENLMTYIIDHKDYKLVKDPLFT